MAGGACEVSYCNGFELSCSRSNTHAQEATTTYIHSPSIHRELDDKWQYYSPFLHEDDLTRLNYVQYMHDGNNWLLSGFQKTAAIVAPILTDAGRSAHACADTHGSGWAPCEGYPHPLGPHQHLQ